jgi:hypothetical protein
MAARGSCVLFASLVFCFNAIVVSSLTHDEKVDMITEAYMSLKFVVQSLIDVQTDIEEGAATTENDISTLDDSKTRSEYEVTIMKVDHQMMLAELAKRQEVVTPEEQQVKNYTRAGAKGVCVGVLGKKFALITRQIHLRPPPPPIQRGLASPMNYTHFYKNIFYFL